MRELETKDKAERVAEGSVFSSGLDTLSKYLRAVFMLLVVLIALLLIWFFTFSGFFTVKPGIVVVHAGEQGSDHEPQGRHGERRLSGGFETRS